MEMTITLSRKEVENIIREHMSSKFKNIKDMDFVISSKQMGCQKEPYMQNVFDKLTCKVEV